MKIHELENPSTRGGGELGPRDVEESTGGHDGPGEEDWGLTLMWRRLLVLVCRCGCGCGTRKSEAVG